MQKRQFIILSFLFALIFSSVIIYAAETPRKVTIAKMEGSVLIQAKGKAIALPASKGTELKAGDRIITGKDGKVEISFDDGSVTRVASNSRMDFEQLSQDTGEGTTTTVINATWGKVWNKVQHLINKNSRFEVNTPSAVAGVRGTDYAVYVERLTTKVRVYRGLVGVNSKKDNAGNGTLVNPHMQTKVTGEGTLSQEADTLDVMEIDEWEKDNLAEDVPSSYVIVDIEIKTILVAKMEEKIQEGWVDLAKLAKELEKIKELQDQENDQVRKEELKKIENQIEKEIGLKRDLVRESEKEKNILSQEKERLSKVKEIIDQAPADIKPEELDKQIKDEVKAIREEEKEKTAQRVETQEKLIEIEQEVNELSLETDIKAEKLDIKASLVQAQESISPQIIQQIKEAQNIEEVEKVFTNNFIQEAVKIIIAPEEDSTSGEDSVPETSVSSPPTTQDGTKTDNNTGSSGGRKKTYYTVVSVAPLNDINVKFGTPIGNVTLPTTVGITLSSGGTVNVPVTWDEGSPMYDGNISGIYTFNGTLNLSGLLNVIETDKKAGVKVIVAQLLVENVNVVDANTIQVLFNNGENVQITLQQKLNHGDNQVTFSYQGYQFTKMLNYIDPQVVALEEATKAVATAEASQSQADVDAAQVLVNALPVSTDKEQLIVRLDAVQSAIDEAKAILEAIAKAKSAVEVAEASKTQGDVDAAQALINGLIEGVEKVALQTRLDAVQSAIDEAKAILEAIAKAKSAVEAAEASKTQGDVDAAQDLINGLIEGVEKTALQTRIDAVQKIIDEETALKEAFENATKAVVTAEISRSQGDVDTARVLVNALPAGNDKTLFQTRLNVVQNAINEAKAIAKVIAAARSAVELAEASQKQGDVDAAQTLVNGLIDAGEKAALQARLDAVQKIIDDANTSEPGTPASVELKIEEINGGPGAVVESPVILSSDGRIAGMQFDVNYDSGLLTLKEVRLGALVPEYSLATNYLEGKLRVLLYNLTGETIAKSSGNIVVFDFQVAENTQIGNTCELQLSNVVISDAQANDITAGTVLSHGSFEVVN